MDCLRVDLPAVGQGSQDADFAAGVDAIDVGGGVALSVAERLRLLQRLGEGAVFAAHLGEDEVGGAVEDALDVVDLVGAQALVQRPDDGDAAADARLKQQLDPVFAGQLQQFGALLGDQLLVGGDDALAALQAAFDKAVGRVKPAHYLDDNLHLRVADDLVKVKAELILPGQLGMRAAQVNPFDVQRAAGLALDAVPVFIKDLDNAGTDGAAA